jgi:4-hydroxymandelate oxidase
MEEVAPVAGTWWFQLYLLVDRGRSLEHVRRAELAGASAIILTVDVTVRGRREADERNRFGLPPGMSMPNLLPMNFEGELPSYAELTAWDKAISWRDLEWLAGATRLPVIVKGILSPQDALLATEHGAKAIVVSNHGGRQLDSAVAALDALPAVAASVGDRAEVLLDGGVRRGTDVIKALALGARAVTIGRPILYGLAADGEDGVVRVFDLLRQELTIDMILCGLSDITSIPHGLVVADGPSLPESAV